MADEHRHAAVELRPGDASILVGAAEKPPLPVARVAVGKARRAAKYTDTAVLAPAQDAIVRDVADIKTVVVGKPDRSLEPGVALAEGLEHRIGQHHAPEPLVMNLDVGHVSLRGVAGLAGWVDVQLHRHQHGRLIADGPGAMTLPAVALAAALILAEGEFPGSLLDASAVHALDPPAAREHHDPLRRRVLVPVTDPTHRLDGEHDRGGVGALAVVPLRIRLPDALQAVIRQLTPPLVADAIGVDPEVPVGHRGLLSGIAHGRLLRARRRAGWRRGDAPGTAADPIRGCRSRSGGSPPRATGS